MPRKSNKKKKGGVPQTPPAHMSEEQFEVFYYPVAKGALKNILKEGIKASTIPLTTRSGADYHLKQGNDVVQVTIPSKWVKQADYGMDLYATKDILPSMITSHTNKHQGE